jgi:hypothetical protein
MLLGTMGQNQDLADAYTENFNYPEIQWDRLSTPARIHAWIDRTSGASRQTVAA